MRGDNVLDVAEYITAMMFTTFNGLIFNMIEIFDILHHIKEKTIKQIPKKIHDCDCSYINNYYLHNC